MSSPLVVPVFVSHRGCPQRCLFCNQRALAGPSLEPGDVRREVLRFLSRAKPRPKELVEVAFYGGSFTAIDHELQRSFLQEARSLIDEGLVGALRVSTRPDSLSHESLDLLKRYKVRTVELGAQSMNDRVLAETQRGHTAEDTRHGVAALKERGFFVGVQLMAGLPGDTPGSFFRSVDEAVSLAPDLVRIYPTLVLEGTGLAERYREGSYLPLSLDDTVVLLARAVKMFEDAEIRVARLGLPLFGVFSRPEYILAGPAHPSLGYLVRARIALNALVALLSEERPAKGSLAIRASRRHISEVRGPKNSNLDTLKAKFSLERIEVMAREGLKRHEYELFWR